MGILNWISGKQNSRRPPAHAELISLEFGCGERPPRKGYLGVDIRAGKYVAYVCNAWDIGAHVAAGSVEAVFSRHFFEHLTFHQAEKTVSVWRQVLREGGGLEMVLPDLDYHVQQIQDASKWEQPSDANREWTHLEHAMAGLWGWQRESDSSTWDLHKSGYSYPMLEVLLSRHGFKDIRRVEDKPWNLSVACIK